MTVCPSAAARHDRSHGSAACLDAGSEPLMLALHRRGSGLVPRRSRHQRSAGEWQSRVTVMVCRLRHVCARSVSRRQWLPSEARALVLAPAGRVEATAGAHVEAVGRYAAALVYSNEWGEDEAALHHTVEVNCDVLSRDDDWQRRRVPLNPQPLLCPPRLRRPLRTGRHSVPRGRYQRRTRRRTCGPSSWRRVPRFGNRPSSTSVTRISLRQARCGTWWPRIRTGGCRSTCSPRGLAWRRAPPIASCSWQRCVPRQR